MTCDCCKTEIRKIYHETETVYKANARLEQEIESLNACIKELELQLSYYNENFKETKKDEKEPKMDCTISGNCRCWCCNISA